MVETMSALAEPNRLRIVALLRGGARSVGEISDELQLRQPQVSKHLQTLKSAGLVAMRAEAQRRLCELRPEPFAELKDWLEDYRQLWDERFDQLDSVIRQIERREQKKDPKEKRHDDRRKK